MPTLPPTHKALVQEVYGGPLVVKTLPTPQATPGSAVIKVISAPIISYMREVYNGTRKYPYPTPMTPGTNAIGRVVAIGPDATLLKEGDLVYFDCTIRGRDDDTSIILNGLSSGMTPGAQILIEGEWRDSTYAEYARLPLENLFKLDEARLLGPTSEGGLGYEIGQLGGSMTGLVAYGGLRSIVLQAGETIIISPASGGFGSAAVLISLALGARVIAMGRNAKALANAKALNPGRVETVQMTGDVETETAALKKFGPIDAFFDISPPEAADSTHFKSAILSLRHSGRISLMGGIKGDLAIPHRTIMRNDLTIRGKWMYSRADCLHFVKLLQTGVLDVRNVAKIEGIFKLEEWKEALDAAAERGGRLGQVVMFTP
ncbi:alcohol dehydrogenase [Xylariaceae sp. FL0255]|nr:alcohol dehydrogenase [Xylariaceae sp. FL0255]